MSAYRSSGSTRVAKLTFGDRKRAIRMYVLGSFIIALGVASAIALHFVLGGAVAQYSAWICAIGILLLARPGWGAIEIDRRLGVVRTRSNGHIGQTQTIALADVRGVAIEMRPDRRMSFVLVLTLDQGRSVELAQSFELDPLKPSCDRILAFLRAEGVVSEDPNVRIAGPPAPELLDQSWESDEAQRGRMRS